MVPGGEVSSGYRRAKEAAAAPRVPVMLWLVLLALLALLAWVAWSLTSAPSAATESTPSSADASFATLVALLSESPAPVETPMFEASPIAPAPIPVVVLEPTPTALAAHEIRATAEANAVCPMNAEDRARIPEPTCKWPTATPEVPPTPRPTNTPVPVCETPVPGRRCDPHGGNP